jgi:hypothetical protein
MLTPGMELSMDDVLQCPAPDCRSAKPPQHYLSGGEQRTIGLEPWLQTAQVCGYCGCVYSHLGHGMFHIRGYFDDPARGRGWRSLDAPACFADAGLDRAG